MRRLIDWDGGAAGERVNGPEAAANRELCRAPSSLLSQPRLNRH